MGEKKWTSEQKRAIDLTGRDLLVSAGAGSGKTSVMTERIIEHICDADNPADLDEMLIVTFTTAAAGELRSRIADGLRRRLAAAPASRHIRRQLDGISGAHISTINSFCLDIVRSNFAVIGLPASLRIADETETQILANQVMEDTIEQFFSRGKELGIDDFDSFTENFISERDDSLAKIFLSIYSQAQSTLRGTQTLLGYAEKLAATDAQSFIKSDWGRVIYSEFFETVRYYRRVYTEAIEYFAGTDIYEKKYLRQFREDLEYIEMLLAPENVDYLRLQQLLTNASFSRIGGGAMDSELKTDKLAFFLASRQEFKDLSKDFANNEFGLPADKVGNLAYLTSVATRDLYTFLDEYDKRFSRTKIRMGILSFADSERYALRILRNDDGSPTPTALEYRERFREVYIDEYQDTNELQDTIFKLISKPRSRFIVGDIKQSIYRFRSAEPSLFIGYRNSWQPYAPDDGCEASSIFLSSNFRSTEKIINTVNAVFTPLFSTAGNIGYCEEDELRFPETKEPDNNPATVRIALVEKKAADKHKNSSEDEDAEAESDSREEAVYTANEIQKLIERGVSFGEIAVLAHDRIQISRIKKELAAKSIPYTCAVGESLFDFPEIQLFMSVLRVIDNPTAQIDLAAVLASPLYGVSIDELAQMRLNAPADASLLDIVSASDKEACRKLICDLDVWREKSRSMQSDKLIRLLLEETDLKNAVMRGRSPASRALVLHNIERFTDLARAYEENSFKGLYPFIEYCKTLSSENGAKTDLSASADSVNIMTIHASKGLEFPYCFVYEADALLLRHTATDNILFTKELGLGMYVREKESQLRFDTPFRSAIKHLMINQAIEDELRVLYVAMTRAKKELWVVGSMSKPDEKIPVLKESGKYICSAVLRITKNYLTWILRVLAGAPSSGDWKIEIVRDPNEGFGNGLPAGEAETEVPADSIDYYREELKKRFEFRYAHEAAARIPAKLSVSRLYPGVLDEEDSSAELDVSRGKKLRVPSFADGGAQTGGSARGTATHLFMQFCDFELLRTNGVDSELRRLTQQDILSAETAELVSREGITAFIHSRVFGEICASAEVWRERRFNVLLPAALFTESEDEKQALADERILVQGVVDCVYMNAEGDMVLLDYKTDYTGGMSDTQAREMLTKRHAEQLRYYRLALEKLTGAHVAKTMLYSFGLSDTVEIL